MSPTAVYRRRRGIAPAPSTYGSINRRTWDRGAELYERRNQRSLERDGGLAWGTWRIPERRLRLLGDVRGRDVLELGCGAGWWSIALARKGARVVGLDFSSARLDQARDRMRRAGVEFPLVQARAERIPYPAARFDLVLSDYGATTFSDPDLTVPEVARVLRPGGSLVFSHASPFRSLTQDFRADRQTRRLMRDYFGLHVLRTRDSVEFQLPYGEWVELFARCGLVVERLIEPPAPRSWQSTYASRADQAWARRWPYEAIWKLRKVARRTDRPARTARGPG